MLYQCGEVSETLSSAHLLPTSYIIYILLNAHCVVLMSACLFCLSVFLPQLPNGVTYHPNTHQDRLGKLQEHLRMLSVLFRKLRLVYDKCSENCAGLEPIPPEVTAIFHTFYTAQGQSSSSTDPKIIHTQGNK